MVIKRDMEVLKNNRYTVSTIMQPERDTSDLFKEKETFLMEKEFRLKLQEELNSKSDLLSNALLENEKLRKDVMKANYSKQTRELMISNEYLNDKIKNDLIDNLGRIEALKHEIEGLKVKLIEKERYIEDQKREHIREMRDADEKAKHEYHEMITKIKMDMGEDILSQKEKCMKLRTESDILLKRNEELSSDYTNANKRLKQLEEQCKLLHSENNELKNEYAFEQRNVEKWHRNNLEMSTAVSAKDKVKRQLENRIKELERKYEEKEKENSSLLSTNEELKTKYNNHTTKDRKEIGKLTITLEKLKANIAHKESVFSDERDMYVVKINKLREENIDLKTLLQSYQGEKDGFTSSIKYNNDNMRISLFNREPLSSEDLSTLKLKGLLIKAIHSKNELKSQLISFIKIYKNSIKNESKVTAIQKLDFFNYNKVLGGDKYGDISESNEMKKYKEQFLSIIAKILRKVSENKTISLIFENIDLGDSFSKIIAGLKINQFITELNLNNSGLNDSILSKLIKILKDDKMITTLKIGYNNFTPIYVSRLFETLRTDNMNISKIDVSGLIFNKDSLLKFKDFLYKRSFINKITMKSILTSATKNNNLEKPLCELFKVFKSMNGLKSLILSDNKLNGLVTKTLFEELSCCKSIEELRLSNIDLYLHQDSDIFEELVNILTNNKQYQCFDVSKNNLSNSTILTILTLFCKQPNLVDLTLSEQFLDDKSIKMLVKVLKTNKKIAYLDLSDCQLSFYNSKQLVEPISESINLKLIKLDMNNITDTFIGDLCDSVKNLTQKDFSFNEELDHKENDEFTINASSEEDKTNETDKFGLATLSLENNKITDNGVETLCDLLNSKCYFIRKLSLINLLNNQMTEKGAEMINKTLSERRDNPRAGRTSQLQIIY